jgi:hypothetical protein
MNQPSPPSGPAAFWDQRYAGPPGASFGTAPNGFLAAHAHLFQRGQRALVPGDGEGRNGIWLAEQGLLVDTVDASPTGVAHARELAAARGVVLNAVTADLTTWAWPSGIYDAVVSIFVHFGATVRADMHARMMASLKPGGILLLEGYSPKHLAHRATGTIGGPQDPAMLFTCEALRQDFAGAEIITLVETEVDLAEGTRHVGRSTVVRLIARKP